MPVMLILSPVVNPCPVEVMTHGVAMVAPVIG